MSWGGTPKLIKNLSDTKYLAKVQMYEKKG